MLSLSVIALIVGALSIPFAFFALNGGGVFLSLLNEWYSALDGILLEVTKYPELEKARKLHAFYQRNGYGDVDCAYTCYGAPTALMYRPLAGAPDISAQVKAIMKDCYLPLYSEKQQAEYIGIN